MNEQAPASGVAGLIILWSIGVTVFWMWIGYRAMMAHERIASALEKKLGQQ